jgi:hypothetical protein
MAGCIAFVFLHITMPAFTKEVIAAANACFAQYVQWKMYQ